MSGGRRNQPAPKCTGPILHQWAQKLFTKQFLTKTTKHLDIAPGQLLMMQEVSEHSFDNDDDSNDDDDHNDDGGDAKMIWALFLNKLQKHTSTRECNNQETYANYHFTSVIYFC